MEINIKLPVKKLPPKSYMGLHTEIARLETEEHGELRFCEHFNGMCYFLQTPDQTFQIDTEDMVNTIVNAIMDQHAPAEVKEPHDEEEQRGEGESTPETNAGETSPDAPPARPAPGAG